MSKNKNKINGTFTKGDHKYKIKDLEEGDTKSFKPADGKEGPTIDVKGVSKGWFRSEIEVSGKKEKIGWNYGFWASITASILILTGLIVLAVINHRKKNNTEEEAL